MVATRTAPQARVGAPIYVTDHKPLVAFGKRATGTLAVGANETIDMCKLPKGARIIDAWMFCSAAGTGTTVDLGCYRIDTDAAIDADGIIYNADLNTSPFGARPTGLAQELLLGTELAYDAYVRATFRTTVLTDAVDFYVFVWYQMA